MVKCAQDPRIARTKYPPPPQLTTPQPPSTLTALSGCDYTAFYMGMEERGEALTNNTWLKTIIFQATGSRISRRRRRRSGSLLGCQSEGGERARTGKREPTPPVSLAATPNDSADSHRGAARSSGWVAAEGAGVDRQVGGRKKKREEMKGKDF